MRRTILLSLTLLLTLASASSADEAGSWQVGVLWVRVLPAWFRSNSPGLDPYEWAETVVGTLNDFAGYRMDELLKTARGIATPDQRKALAKYEHDLRRQP